MGIHPYGSLVRDRMMASLSQVYTQVIFQAFRSEVENIRLRSSNVYRDTLVLDTVDHILEMPAGLANSNFVEADIRETFRKAVVCAGRIRGMMVYGLVNDWEMFVEQLEELYGYLSRLEVPVTGGGLEILEIEVEYSFSQWGGTA